ncbi:hypothetical protein F3G64_36130 [Pseudomonas aeruginosa]|nr:hypothetical protein F3G64_36130 [Pseudomonas aeruginosa]
MQSVALDLHTAVRGWSSRDNEIVGVAKRMAVLMAKLSEYMNTGLWFGTFFFLPMLIALRGYFSVALTSR